MTKEEKLTQDELMTLYETLERDENTQAYMRVLQGERNFAAMQKIAAKIEKGKKETKE